MEVINMSVYRREHHSVIKCDAKIHFQIQMCYTSINFIFDCHRAATLGTFYNSVRS